MKSEYQILERANELRIYIPNTYDISGDNNMINCVYKISEYADNLLNQELRNYS